MKYLLNTSLILILLMVSSQSSHANDSGNSAASLKSETQNISDQNQYVLPPPSPFFSSKITLVERLETIKTPETEDNSIKEEANPSEDMPLGSNNLKSRINELETALKDNQNQANILLEELHATAKNADFENDMFEKTVSQLQEKITELKNENKTLTSKLSKNETKTGSQQRLLTSLKQESAELTALKSAYRDRNNEAASLKEQLANLKKETEIKIAALDEASATETEVQTLRDAYTVKSEESEGLKNKLNELDLTLISLQETVEKQKTDIERFTESSATHEQTLAELNDLQVSLAESNDNNALLKTKIVELDDSNKTLKSQLDKMQQDESQQTRKIGLLDQTTAELTALKSAYKERNDEAKTLKEKVVELEISNKTLLSRIEQLEKDAKQNSTKLGLLGQSNTELADLKSAYKAKEEESFTLKEKITNLDDSNKTLLSRIEQLEGKASENDTKLTLLDQTTADLTALKNTYKERNDEVVALKEKNTTLDDSNKTLQSKIVELENNASQNTRKLDLLNQSMAELNALKSAYKERNDEAASLKEKNTALDDSNKTLQSKIVELENNASQNTRKLGLLGQSTTELNALKSAYKERNDEATKLTRDLASSDDKNKTLLSEIEILKGNASKQTQKLGLLDKSTAELAALKSAYKDRNDENIELKQRIFDIKKNEQRLNQQIVKINSEIETLNISKNKLMSENSDLTVKLNEHRTLKNSLESSTTAKQKVEKQLKESENQRKTLSSKLKTLESELSNQKRQLNNLSTVSKELNALKNAYQDIKQEKLTLEDNHAKALLDNDNDGVISQLDQCPSSPAGSSVNNIGCPEIPDADGDKVADTNDLCPNTATNTSVNKFGCVDSESITLDGVNFATGSDRLTLSSLPIINAAAATLISNPSINVEVAGYTDNSGLRSVNQRLSKRRADSVANQFIKQGVNSNRVTTKGYGENNPIASNSTESGRLINRRVELKIR